MESTVIARFGAVPTRAIRDLRTPELLELLHVLHGLDQEIIGRRETISAILHATVGRIDPRDGRNRVLSTRRDLYNERRLAPDRSEWLHGLLDANDRAAVAEYEELLSARQAATERAKAVYPLALRTGRRALQRAVGHPSFRNGVVLSSSSLFGNIARYQRNDPDRISARDEQIERGILRYLTRAAMKATPFSTFCSIVSGSLRATSRTVETSPFVLSGRVASQRSHLRLNKSLYSILWSALRSKPQLRRALVLAPNPTLAATTAQWTFLTDAGDREIFRRVTRNEAIDLVHTVARAGRVTFGQLVSELVRDPDIDTSEEEATAYVNSLVNVGFLRFASPVPEQEVDWDRAFCGVLQSSDDDSARQVVDLLRDLRQEVDDAQQADAERRASIFDRMRAKVAEVSASLVLPALPRSDALVYEDASSDGSIDVLVDRSLERGLEVLTEVIGLTLPVAHPRGAMATMRHFFETHYTDTKAVPLLTFYEDFYREHLRDHIAKERMARSGTAAEGYNLMNPFGLEFINSIHRAQGAMTAVFATAWSQSPTADEVVIKSDDLRNAARQIAGVTACRSASAFAVLVPTRGDTPARLVVPAATYFPGYGKYFSRFLYLLPPHVMKDIMASNDWLTPDLLAEIGGDAAFNANLHPPILPFELAYPTGDAPVAGTQLSCVDLDVVRDSQDQNALGLLHRPSGRRVWPIDLGFLSVLRRPPLYQLLIRFMPAGSFSFALPETMTLRRSNSQRHGTSPSAAGETSLGVTYRPRFVIDGAVVVARRRWTIPAAAFLAQRPGQTHDEYFLEVNRWRLRHNIPDEVYVRIRPLPDEGAQQARPAKSEEAVEGHRDAEGEATQVQSSNASPAAAALDMPDTEAAEVDTRSEEVNTVEEVEPSADAERSETPGSPGAAPAVKPARREGWSRDWWKPQYIDFGSPLLVRLFARLPTGLKNYVMHLEERYPTNEELPTSEGEPHSAEFILQFSFPAARREFVDTTDVVEHGDLASALHD